MTGPVAQLYSLPPEGRTTCPWLAFGGSWDCVTVDFFFVSNSLAKEGLNEHSKCSHCILVNKYLFKYKKLWSSNEGKWVGFVTEM